MHSFIYPIITCTTVIYAPVVIAMNIWVSYG